MLRRWYLLGALLVLALASGCSKPAPSTPSPTPTSSLMVASEVGALAPDFELSTLAGQSIRLSDLRDRPVLLNFWATWCGPCVAEMPFLEAAFNKKKGEGLVILAVNVGESKARVKQFIQLTGFTFPVGLDYYGNVATIYGIWVFPTTFLIDRQGIIRLVKISPFTSEADVLATLKRVM